MKKLNIPFLIIMFIPAIFSLVQLIKFNVYGINIWYLVVFVILTGILIYDRFFNKRDLSSVNDFKKERAYDEKHSKLTKIPSWAYLLIIIGAVGLVVGGGFSLNQHTKSNNLENNYQIVEAKVVNQKDITIYQEHIEDDGTVVNEEKDQVEVFVVYELDGKEFSNSLILNGIKRLHSNTITIAIDENGENLTLATPNYVFLTLAIVLFVTAAGVLLVTFTSIIKKARTFYEFASLIAYVIFGVALVYSAYLARYGVIELMYLEWSSLLLLLVEVGIAIFVYQLYSFFKELTNNNSNYLPE